MNKKANTILFMLGATVLNVVMMVVIFLALMLLYAWIVPGGFATQVGQVVGIVLFLGSIGLTYFLYHKMVKWISNKWNLDDYFDPIFGKRGGQDKKPGQGT
ncbi:MAG TPA: hypothetical protein VKA06_03515 [Spirochaetia bacterium]|jgi:hypothetical protein|nr:hypothetical protein [Spirochaetia bacterium]